MRELFATGAMLCFLVSITLVGCRFGDAYPYESDSGVSAIVYQLQSQYGIGGKYSVIQMSYDDSVGLVINATGVVEGSTDLVVRRMKRGKWSQLSSASLKTMVEQPFLFTLDSISDLKKIPDLINSSCYKLSAEIRKPGLHAKEVMIHAPGFGLEGDLIRISIHIHPQDALGKFEYSYNTAGVLQDVQQY
ncbi:MAG: hypothetical protein J7578_18790 [Chitinophagaceae bacterium]|nr:hypothetical protein [Chitinophagaceae bacterium]